MILKKDQAADESIMEKTQKINKFLHTKNMASQTETSIHDRESK